MRRLIAAGIVALALGAGLVYTLSRIDVGRYREHVIEAVWANTGRAVTLSGPWN